MPLYSAAPPSHLALAHGRGGLLFPARLPRNKCRTSHVAGSLFDVFARPAKPAVELPPEDEAGAALRMWLEQQGMPQQKIMASLDPAWGRALLAKDSIPKGAVAVQVPGSLAVMAATAARQLALGEALLEEHPLPAWSVLALWLAEARAGGAAGHPWAPYVALLPWCTGCVLEWSEEQVDWLRGSQLHAVAREVRSAARASWEEMQPLLAAAERHGLAAPGAFTRQALDWAFSMLLTRLIRLPGLGDQEALVPWADLLNHDCGAQTHLDWDAAAAAVVLRADRPYRPGEQVFVSYGEKTSGQLLLSYGFLPPPGTNPHDGCLLEMQLHAGDPALAWKREVLEQRGLPAAPTFPLRMGALPQGLLECAALAGARGLSSRGEVQQLGERLFGPVGRGGGGGSGSGGGGSSTGLTGGSIELHRAALGEVAERCQAALKGYPTPLEALKRELEEQQQQQAQVGERAPAGRPAAGRGRGGGGAPPRQARRRRQRGGAGAQSEPQQQEQQQEHEEQELWRQRRRQVVQVLVQEQQVLSRAAFLLQQELRQLRRG